MQSTESPLNQQTIERIKGWASNTEANEFRQVMAALAVREELAALLALKQSDGEDNGYRVSALEHMDMAKQYYFILHVMDSVALGHSPDEPEAKFPFITLKIEQPSGVKTPEELLKPE